MQISDLKHQSIDDKHTLSAAVAWEDNDRPKQNVFFRTQCASNPFEGSNYNAFLVACISPALHFGERRIRIDGEVCPWLADNMTTLTAWLNHWYWYDQGHRRGESVAIEARYESRPLLHREPRVGAFFSGGVDSLYTLRKNHSSLPEGHPGRIRDVIFVHGFDFGHRPDRGSEDGAFEFFIKEFAPVFRETQVDAIPMWTNVYQLGVDSVDFWLREFMGPAMGAVANSLSGRISDCIVASSYNIETLHSFSSHPVIEPRLGSFALRVHHDAERMTRLGKVKVIADWPVALKCLRVCFFGEPGKLNCGVCAKCVRTKIELQCAGKLRETRSFENCGLDADLIRRALTITPSNVFLCTYLVRELARSGNLELSRALKLNVWLYFLRRAADARMAIASMDRRIFGGVLKNFLRRGRRPRKADF